MQVLLLFKTCLPSDTQPIHNKSIAVFSSADTNKCKQKTVLSARLKSLPAALEQWPYPAVQQSRSFQSRASPARAPHPQPSDTQI